MTCEHHWHDEGIWEFCCTCNAHKCEAIQRVRELHKPVEIEGTREGLRWCGICSDEPNNLVRFPCYTIMALDGEQ